MKPIECQQCEFTSKHKNSVRRHVKYYHESNGPQFHCPLCVVSIRWSKSNLDLHIKRAHGIRDKFCTQCDFAAACDSDLTQHERRVHEQRYVKDIECNQCGNRFKSNGQFRNHEKHIHEGIPRPKTKRGIFPCSLCPKIFEVKRNRTRHEKNIHQ